MLTSGYFRKFGLDNPVTLGRPSYTYSDDEFLLIMGKQDFKLLLLTTIWFRTEPALGFIWYIPQKII